MNTTKAEKTVKEILLGKCWEYFNDNFHKFTEANRIKIGLALCLKDMPTQFDPETLPKQNIVIIRDGNKTQAIPGQVCVQSSQTSSDGGGVGNGEVNVRNIAGNDILRADTKQPGNSIP